SAAAHSLLGGVPKKCVWQQPMPGATDTSSCTSAGAAVGRMWLLDDVVDRFSNEMQIDYLNGPSQPDRFVPSEIRYGLRPGSTGNALRKVLFTWEARPDSRVLSMAGVPHVADQRLSRIDMVGPLGLSDAAYASAGSGTLR